MNHSDKQVMAVIKALVEAAQPMSELLKANNEPEFNQVLSSYITAIQAVQPHIQALEDQSSIKLINEIQQNLSLTEREMKQNNVEQSLRIVEKSMTPNTIKLFKQISATIENKPTIIGLYHAENNPVLSYNNNRIATLYKEAKKQNCKLYMFESKDVNMQTGEIKARKSLKSQATKIIQIPDVIYNIFPKINYVHDDVEKWLRKRAPFSTFPINNKIDLPRKISETSDLGHLFLPFKKVTSTNDVFAFLLGHKQAVLKKYAASRGESIYFIEQTSRNEYELKARNTIQTFDQMKLNAWLEQHIVDEKFIVQEYKEFKTHKDEPYDIRAHVQKNATGKWVLTKMYPRIGMAGTIISNVSQGGRTENIEKFLSEQFGNEKASQIRETLETLALEIAETIDHIYNGSIDELGLDLAIAPDEQIYMHEANLKPRIRYYEAERAVHTIGYLKYLAKNRLFLTNEVQEM